MRTERVERKENSPDVNSMPSMDGEFVVTVFTTIRSGIRTAIANRTVRINPPTISVTNLSLLFDGNSFFVFLNRKKVIIWITTVCKVVVANSLIVSICLNSC